MSFNLLFREGNQCDDWPYDQWKIGSLMRELMVLIEGSIKGEIYSDDLKYVTEEKKT